MFTPQYPDTFVSISIPTTVGSPEPFGLAARAETAEAAKALRKALIAVIETRPVWTRESLGEWVTAQGGTVLPAVPFQTEVRFAEGLYQLAGAISDVSWEAIRYPLESMPAKGRRLSDVVNLITRAGGTVDTVVRVIRPPT